MSHDHSHTHSAEVGHPGPLLAALAITCLVVVVEVVGGIAFHSLALSADAAHMFSDAVALGIGVIAQRVAARPASSTHSFGWQRSEVVAAQGNGLLLIIVSLWLVVEAIRRFSSPQLVHAGGLIAVAIVGLVANLASTIILRRSASQNMNVRAAALHTLSDAAGSFGAMVAGIAIAFGASSRVDPAISLFITALVIVAAGRLVFDSTHVLLEATPRHLRPEEIEAALLQAPAVVRVHHLHLWTIAPGSVALSAHIELEGIDALHDAQAEGEQLKAMLADQFGIGHSTLELECHPCAPSGEC